jgi:hypothetical protein
VRVVCGTHIELRKMVVDMTGDEWKLGGNVAQVLALPYISYNQHISLKINSLFIWHINCDVHISCSSVSVSPTNDPSFTLL